MRKCTLGHPQARFSISLSEGITKVAAGSDKQVHVQYYALLRDERGVGAETLRTGATTVSELYNELRERHGFSLGIERLSLAVNDEFATWERQLADKDQVVFIPPVAGG